MILRRSAAQKPAQGVSTGRGSSKSPCVTAKTPQGRRRNQPSTPAAAHGSQQRAATRFVFAAYEADDLIRSASPGFSCALAHGLGAASRPLATPPEGRARRRRTNELRPGGRDARREPLARGPGRALCADVIDFKLRANTSQRPRRRRGGAAVARRRARDAPARSMSVFTGRALRAGQGGEKRALPRHRVGLRRLAMNAARNDSRVGRSRVGRSPPRLCEAGPRAYSVEAARGTAAAATRINPRRRATTTRRTPRFRRPRASNPVRASNPRQVPRGQARGRDGREPRPRPRDQPGRDGGGLRPARTSSGLDREIRGRSRRRVAATPRLPAPPSGRRRAGADVLIMCRKGDVPGRA